MAFVFTQKDPQVFEIVQQLKIKGDISVSFSFVKDAPLQISKVENNASIIYGKRAELFRGLGLLAEHSEVPQYKATQKAHFTMNGAMLDCSRNGVLNINSVKRMIRYMALMGHSMLMLYTEDTYEVPEYPYFGYMRGRYSQKELKELDTYAQGYGIELIPCIQTLAHLSPALRWQCFDEIKDTDDILLCGEEKTYEFIEAMIRACRNSFRSKRIHIGMDEAFMLGLGKYREKNGHPEREKIFCDHLKRVNEICKKYDFKPMIWSDMFYRLAFGGAYETDGSIAQEVKKLIPDNVDLVYWDYYQHDAGAYQKAIASHQEFDNNILFAGGAWRWLGFAPHIQKSQEASRVALEVCIGNGMREVFCTAWGDDGNEASMFTILPTLQLFAEYSYQGSISDEALKKRLFACTGERLSDMMLMDLPDMPDGVYHQDITNPSCYLLYSDVLGSLFEKHCHPCYKENYMRYADELFAAAKRSSNHSDMYEMLAELCSLLSVKSCVSADAYAAYQSGDREGLRVIAEETLPAVQQKLESFRNAVEICWMKEFKRSGYEVLDIRLGGVNARVKNAIRQINAYLSGEIEQIEELEDPRLSFNNKPEEELQKDPVMCWCYRRDLFTPNRLVW